MFSDTGPELNSHTFVDAWDEDSRRWEALDPDRDLAWRDLAGRPLSTPGIVLGALAEAVPAGPRGEGWEATGADDLRGFFGAVLIERRVEHERPLLLVNTARFDLDHRFADGRTFLESAAERYGDPLVVLERGR